MSQGGGPDNVGPKARLRINDGATLSLTQTVVRFAGGSDLGAIYNSSGTATITLTDSTVEQSATSGIYVNSFATLTLTDSTVQNNNSRGVFFRNGALSAFGSTFSGNGSHGIESSSPKAPVLLNNTFQSKAGAAVRLNSLRTGTLNPVGNSASSTTTNGIQVSLAVGSGQELILRGANSDAFPYVFTGGSVSSGGSLTIDAGSVVKFADGVSLSVNGADADMAVAGTFAAPVIFTSIHDDSVGGDTNNNGSATSAGPGDWRYIIAVSGATLDLANARMRYGGGSSAIGMLRNTSGSADLTISDSVIEHSAAYGIYMTVGTSSLALTNSTIRNNSGIGVYHVGPEISVSGATIRGNGSTGLYLAGIDGSPSIIDSEVYENAAGIIAIDGLTLTVRDTVVRNNAGDGFQLTRTGLRMTGGSLEANTGHGLHVQPPSTLTLPLFVELRTVNIVDNGGDGVRNTRPLVICADARSNFWGDATGPEDLTATADHCGPGVTNAGLGSTVTNGVDYGFWASEAIPLAESPSEGALDKRADRPTIWVGGTLTYTVRLSHVGTTDATGAEFVDALPDDVSYVAASTQGAITTEPSFDNVTRTLHWPVSTLPDPGETIEFQYQVTVGSPSPGTTLTNTMELIAPALSDPVSDPSSVLVVQPEIFSISPTRGGADGTVHVRLEGRHLSSDSSVRLDRSGEIIEAVEVHGVEESRLEAKFVLFGATTGLWDVVVTPPGGAPLSLSNAFTIEATGQVDLSIDIVGRGDIRLNAPSRFWVQVTNQGNIDAYDNWVYVDVPHGLDYKILESIDVGKMASALEQAGADPEAIESLGSIDWDSVPVGRNMGSHDRIALWLPSLPAGSVSTAVLEVTPREVIDPGISNITAGAAHFPTEFARTGDPDDFALQLPKPLTLPWGQWRHQLVENVTCPTLGYCEGDPNLSDADRALLFWTNEFLAETGTIVLTMTACSVASLILAPATGGASLIVGGACLAIDLISIWSLANQVTDMDFSVVRPVDPNIKIGPSGAGEEEHFVNPDSPMSYTVMFESDPDEATAPAQHVRVVDQLDEDLDWTTFEFEGAWVAGLDVPVTVAGDHMSGEVTVPFNGGTAVTVEGFFDPDTGIVEWTFAGPDGLDDPFTPTPFRDFLPVNNPAIAPEGEGFVRYSVKPNADLPTGTLIDNFATITFDEHVGGGSLTTPTDQTSYHAAFDRDTSDPEANLWNVRPPNGRIDGFDIGFVIVQFGHTCAPPPARPAGRGAGRAIGPPSLLRRGGAARRGERHGRRARQRRLRDRAPPASGLTSSPHAL